MSKIKHNDMYKINNEYGMYFGEMDWNFIATWRPHYPLTTYSSDKRISELVKHKGIERVFFALEKDMHPDMVHAHLLIQADPFFNRSKLVNALSVNPKQVSYFQPVMDKYKVASYCAKEIGRNVVHYNYFVKGIR